MFEAFLLTPLMLAAEPISLDMPERTYDHRTQNSTYNGVRGLHRLAGTARCCTGGAHTCTYSNKSMCGDSDSSMIDQHYD